MYPILMSVMGMLILLLLVLFFILYLHYRNLIESIYFQFLVENTKIVR